MARVAVIVPEETDLLCEGCGYNLNNLPTTSNCPECGKPIEQSIGAHRHLSAFEVKPGIASFIHTTIELLFRPKRFFRTITTRNASASAKRFATIHSLIATLLFTFAALGHFLWVMDISGNRANEASWSGPFALAALIVIGLSIFGLKRLAAWLSAIEGRYWGMRLPFPVVMRGLLFHTAHYLPVGLVAVAMVWGYRLLLMWRVLNHANDTIYLYSLCGAVIVSAVYLFNTYWIAMRSMMYANR
ncbi:MAG TPA: hypothetical protein VHD56_04700 [Tepidisphaeraceae bacterium]|nr:hypothetical protein [Tepidisphaeraceae bacterium]